MSEIRPKPIPTHKKSTSTLQLTERQHEEASSHKVHNPPRDPEQLARRLEHTRNVALLRRKLRRLPCPRLVVKLGVDERYWYYLFRGRERTVAADVERPADVL